ncbi:hypothetical protein [Microbulbifer yueqingensis]|uniref:Uncharacterized protein n=1 Tax=Microbulbifer yueqingensis TaxID=658219 RepID=A0A1G9EFS1_9GAMM|nr:hypothetical protein [Microbulbifer yueqingensis]SDK75017.1 hypothetical protein SAMN05216212_3107 [Microbulbifer yueqingensis]
MKEKELRRYGRRFISALYPYLKKNYSVEMDIYPTVSEGGVLEFNINQKSNRVRVHEPFRTLSTAISELRPNFIQGNSDRVEFGGTNLFMDNNKVLVVKADNEPSSWNNRAAADDVRKIVASFAEQKNG